MTKNKRQYVLLRCGSLYQVTVGNSLPATLKCPGVTEVSAIVAIEPSIDDDWVLWKGSMTCQHKRRWTKLESTRVRAT